MKTTRIAARGRVWALLGIGVVLVSIAACQSEPAKNVPPRPEDAAPVARQGDSLDLTKVWSGGKCQGNGAVAFTHLPMALEDFPFILPYGAVTDAHVTPIDHMYVSPADWSSARDQYEVRAIADGFIVKIGHRTGFVGDVRTDRVTDEYRLDIEHTCDLYSYFDLVASLDESIIRQAGATITEGQGSIGVRIPIKVGQLVGRIGGQTLDFGVYNNTKHLNFIIAEHYVLEPWKIHTDDPFPYLVEPLRSQLIAKNLRSVEPIAGRIDYDVDGTLLGNWFREGTNGYGGINQQRYWEGHLAFLYDHLDPSAIVISLGDFGGVSRQFTTLGAAPDPNDVDVSAGLVRYTLAWYDHVVGESGEPWDRTSVVKNLKVQPLDGIQGVALFQLTGPRRLKAEVFPGKTPDQVSGFTEGAVFYER
ncbi:MAG: hypothetical protein EXR48_01790 [Dehalococcoidia bacterium]|nr:hypothetical protein [Dehalococcoidia bacterium]